MSVNDLNKVIIVSSALTGCVVFTMDYDDYYNSYIAMYYLYEKIHNLLTDDEGVLVKIGYKS